MRPTVSGPTNSSAPPCANSAAASAGPSRAGSPVPSQRRAISAQVSLSALALVTTFNVIGSRCETAFLADQRNVGAGQAIDQPDLAAAVRNDIGAVHAVDDACQHEARRRGIQPGAVEQLEVIFVADASGFAGQARLVLLDVAIKLAFDRLPYRNHRGKRKEVVIGERLTSRPLRRDDTRETQSPPIKLAQCPRIGDRRTAFEQRRRI